MVRGTLRSYRTILMQVQDCPLYAYQNHEHNYQIPLVRLRTRTPLSLGLARVLHALFELLLLRPPLQLLLKLLPLPLLLLLVRPHLLLELREVRLAHVVFLLDVLNWREEAFIKIEANCELCRVSGLGREHNTCGFFHISCLKYAPVSQVLEMHYN